MEYVDPRMPGTETFNYVDVRDAAEIHVLALATPDAGGQRILASRGESVLLIHPNSRQCSSPISTCACMRPVLSRWMFRAGAM